MAVPVDPGPNIEKGYPIEILVNKEFDKKFQCNHCGLILRDPIQSYCGHRFCRKCVEGVISSGTQVRCSSCIEEGAEEDDYSILRQEQMFPDNALKKEMIKIDVQCINPGCDWKGKFKNYDAHVAECKFRPLQCPQCGITIESSKLQYHMANECPQRKVKCKYCNIEITFAESENNLKAALLFFFKEHYKNCPKFPMKCEACGKKKIPREKMQHHIEKECTQQKVQCLPECGALSREQYMAHLDKKPGLHIAALSEKINRMEVEFGNALQNESLSKTQLLEKLQQQEQAIQSIISAGIPGGSGDLGAGNSQDINGIRTRCQTLELKIGTFEGIVTTLHREIERCITALETSDRQRSADKQKIEENERKIRQLERTVSLKDVALAELDLRIKSLELISFDGTLIWKITEWNKKRREAMAGSVTSIYSPIFYTSRNGYKMCARLYPNGDGMGKSSHISIFFVVMRGNFDALLSWPFTHRVSFMLLDQNNREHIVDSFRPDPTSSSFKRPTSEMNIASGCPLFMPQAKLDDPNLAYVKDDTMFIKITVDLTNVGRVGSG
ncbi:hypothetical protein FSP39_020097 [Pinctada imbricata]|uniref:TNF receptor-associated factor n=1 Tax=Pinctada imbricata TaxID=66713 RepID=A0AA88Y3A7_PINIB|nr:hypothetical protein FSP39_020097 [Pinctada imbricata]